MSDVLTENHVIDYESIAPMIAHMPLNQPLDPARIAELRSVDGGAGKVLARIVQAYLARAPEQLSSLRPLASSGQYGALRLAAHSLKGSSASLGAQQVAQLCQQVELAANAPELPTAGPALNAVLDTLEAEFERVLLRLQELT